MHATRLTLITPEGRELTGDLSTFLTADLRERARVDANAWIKSLRHVPYDDVPMRQRFIYGDDSLWWFTEIYLHKMKRLDMAVSVILALEQACDAQATVGLAIETSQAAARDAAIAFSAIRGLPLEVIGAQRENSGVGWQSYQIGLTAELSRFRGSPEAAARPQVAAFVHTAFWRHSPGIEGRHQESYIGSVLDAIGLEAGDNNLYCVGVGPRRNFRMRKWWDGVTVSPPNARLVTPVERLVPRSALDGSMTLWRNRHALAQQVTSGDGIRAAATYRGYDLWTVIKRELEEVALLQWPWSARAMDEAGAALDALQPRVVLTYAEAGGWGRAIMMEARRRNIPSVGLQHGFIYRHWLNYLHEPDEMSAIGADRGCPIPDDTLVFDRYAERQLREAGHFPASHVHVMGNPRLDQLMATIAALKPMRDALRREFLTSGDQPLAVLAAKFSEIRGVLPDLVTAVKALPGMRLVIKPHPAETADDYAPAVQGVPNISVAEGATDLGRLLTAADLIVTMNSTVAIDGLALGVPALVIGLPNNLSPFVDAGVMLGAHSAEDVRQQLQAVLYDAQVRWAVTSAGTVFAREHALASDGQSAKRTAEAILDHL